MSRARLGAMDAAPVISVELAKRLRDAGVAWEPRAGDRFVIPDRDMDDDVFVISSMVVDVHRFATGDEVLGFNGTVEWALDSVDRENALWLPSEAQLRDRLGGTFRSLVQVADRFRVAIDVSGRRLELDGDTADEAYAHALLYLTTGEADRDSA